MELALEWVKALGAPLAALLAATVAVFGFRYQRRLDRRLDWYASMVKQLGAYSDAVERAKREPATAEFAQAASDAADEAIALVMLGFMYVGPRGQRAIEGWYNTMRPVFGNPVTPAKAAVVTEATANAIYEILFEARQTLGIRELRQTKGREIMKAGGSPHPQ
ncbi:MAG TPA: hypothetical protein VGO40_14880 [Longimicrobium sp.]|jgi:hypothetical protein|nr:hypothetical protein [Longimicrobium sp.]